MHIFTKALFILSLLFLTLQANQELQHEYSVTGKDIMLSDIVNSPKEDARLFQISPSRHSKRVKSKELLRLLKEYGYKNFQAKHAYVQFSQKSPINTDKIKNSLIEYYQEKYKDIKIEKVDLLPSKYMTHLPKEYKVGFSRNAYLSRKGVLYIKTPDNKKIFFNYNMYARLNVYETKKKIEKGEELSELNCKKKSIILEKFRAMPLMDLPRARYEAKHRLKKFSLLTQRDVVGLFLIKRGSHVNVYLQDEGVYITFGAKALQSGRYGDTITVVNQNKKKIHVRVIGKNRAEVR
ncbi:MULTISPECIES: flagellar basal body P-ring formation chaperone FlgA [Sulfurimonas]|uniref:flagellar basal body P-ring formation chaperone FlgA n=1 Tax=Sulfurimonas TaxID=202746 RepID=UPI001264A809|nr:flagellar basal body P-ring formation chaperone FlgA [Sulfurimonas indica]